MASTNFKIFNESHTDEQTYNDSEYEKATQRQSGVIQGIALSRLHNKLYFQVSSMCKAIADYIVDKGLDCNDDDVNQITTNFSEAIQNECTPIVSNHNASSDSHANGIAGNAASASKLEIARTISLTGRATGSARTDFSGDVSVNVTDVSIAGKAINDANGDRIDDTYLKKKTVIDVVYPVGAIYISMTSTNPATVFGVGTWKQISQGRTLIGVGNGYSVGGTGGSEKTTLAVENLPPHSFSGNTENSGGHSHSGSTSMNGEHRHFFYGYNNNNGPYTGDVDGVDTESNSHLKAVDRFNTSAAGNHNHTFNTNHTGAHAHSFSTNTVGSGKSFNNMPPYLAVFIWQRTA